MIRFEINFFKSLLYKKNCLNKTKHKRGWVQLNLLYVYSNLIEEILNKIWEKKNLRLISALICFHYSNGIFILKAWQLSEILQYSIVG